MVNVKIKAKVDQKRGLYKKGDMFDGSEVDLYMFTDGKGRHHFAPKLNFDVVEDNRPVRTITRKEIVEWKDDVLHIVPHEKGCVLVGFVTPEDQTFKSLAAEQCREAAHILNQIAEALEDGATF